MSSRLFAALAATLGTAALLVQLGLFIAPRADSLAGWIRSVGHFLGFFSIDANILAAIALFCGATQSQHPFARFFRRAAIVGCLATSLLLVGIAYELLLRRYYKPTGWNLACDIVLHDVMPALFLIHWWLWADKRTLRWYHAALWCLLPLSFLLVIAIRAKLGGGYTYPFMNVSRLGHPVVARYVFRLLAGTFAVGLFLIAAAKGRESRRARA